MAIHPQLYPPALLPTRLVTIHPLRSPHYPPTEYTHALYVLIHYVKLGREKCARWKLLEGVQGWVKILGSFLIQLFFSSTLSSPAYPLSGTIRMPRWRAKISRMKIYTICKKYTLENMNAFARSQFPASQPAMTVSAVSLDILPSKSKLLDVMNICSLVIVVWLNLFVSVW